jgi:DNA ligase (NAD+)
MNRESDLAQEILKHKRLYYLGQPEISDAAYDALEEKLRKLNAVHPVLSYVGWIDVRTDGKIAHQKKMLSLEKTYTLEQLGNWAQNRVLVGVYKYDGVSCSLVYKDSLLQMAKTRGDGEFGEDISIKLDYIASVPKQISVKSDLEVRGELYCTQENFKLLKEEMKLRGLDEPTSPRNIVAGLMGRKEYHDLCAYLSFAAFDVLVDVLPTHEQTEERKLEWLKSLNFPTPNISLCRSRDDCQELIEKARQFMQEGDFQIDGLVFSYNDLSLHQELGHTSHHPKYRMAYKFLSEQKITRIKEIQWGISRLGVFTPVALVEAVELSGAMVSRVTLHHYKNVMDHGLKVGDEILITRSGEVIPKFLEKVLDNPNEAMLVPKVCPHCSTVLECENLWLVCPNKQCKGAVEQDILFFTQAMGIADLSQMRLTDLIEKNLVKSHSDLFRLTVADFLTLPQVKDLLAKKLFDSVQRVKKVDLVTFMAALGIEGLGEQKIKKIMSYGYRSVEDFLSLTEEMLIKIEGFAKKSADTTVQSLKEKRQLIQELLRAGVEINPLEDLSGGVLTGVKFCITGPLSQKREILEKKIEQEGGINQSNVNKETDYLICNELESSSSKFVKAKKLQIKIINEEEFHQIISGAKI